MTRLVLGMLIPCCILVALPAATAPLDATDPRIAVVDVSKADVIPVRARPGYATQILLPSEEQVVHVVMGEARGWEVAVHGNNLFLKPLNDAQPTNLLVTAEAGGGAQHYRFDLTLATTSQSTPFELRLTKPRQAQDADFTAALAAAEARDRALVEQTLQAAPFEGPRNFAYSAQGALELQPFEVSDNGRFTLLRFPAQQPVPSIYEISAEGVERLVPFHIQDEFLVVHLVAKRLRLRRGERRLCLFNEAFSPYGGAERTGTASQSLTRDLKSAEVRP
ncbi:TrbG/VirB9 family P-type conjugative transfer protein [Phenylobacterium sp.]|uniref:TrbG/VirB9 family P-type conjugative transfer protein n=1 Tax=Phenylobacterium sp. TaxID=1871053 RepID=UPI00272F827B|nr:TrbG/VirB9 family P-type conjugative transfer protein [Phenylobacterium sp.]MDP1875179.1 TrbG/VirB9 family P-type conjugative transfer protein [Phenylobacterium sp.]